MRAEALGANMYISNDDCENYERSVFPIWDHILSAQISTLQCGTPTR
jgi:hypothetical protein